MSDRQIADALARAAANSSFLATAIGRHPDLVARLQREPVADIVGRLSSEVFPIDEALGPALRRRRDALALAVAIADLAGALPLEAVVGALSDFADLALDCAIRGALRERFGRVDPTGLAAIALGKHGSRELNYSSDIDLIFLFDRTSLPVRGRDDAGESAVRLVRRVVELLQERTPDGYVFRIDLRLRPSPEATPVALPLDAAISYYESSALAWERAAFIRARAAAGDHALGARFLEAVQPFVWRRSIDFGAIAELTEMAHGIREHHEGGRLGPGYDVKRGRGGIREVEFLAQMHQLIHGGRDPALRAPATLDALAALAAARRFSDSDAHRLASAYRLLRTVEHRLQMVDDQQTHSLPHGGALDQVARLHGLADGGALLALLAPGVGAVQELFDAIDPETKERTRLPVEPASLEARFGALGFADPAAAARLVGRWRGGDLRALRSAPARAALETMLPALVERIAEGPDPSQALVRFDTVVERLPSGLNFFRLLDGRPALAGVLAQLLSHGAALADRLAERPELLDGLIDATAFRLPGSVDELAEEFGAGPGGEAYEAVLDRVRRAVNERRFALGAQLIVGSRDPLEAAGGYARIAEAAIFTLARACEAAFEERHGRIEGGALVILGLGRLGGRALTDASDLDLVNIFTGSLDASSDGPKPLRATDYYNRLTRRVIAALGAPTAAGALYEVDTRLRPSGGDGMLAVSAEGFSLYQLRDAWTFEHMALTRARAVYGPPAARAEIEARIAEVLRRPRDRAATLADIQAMRGEIARAKPPSGTHDVKLGAGGLVDLEFTVQALQLTTGQGLDPELGRAIRALAATGLLNPEAGPAFALLTRMLVMSRIVAPGGVSGEIPTASRMVVALRCGDADWAALAEAIDAARAVVSTCYRDVLGGPPPV